MRLRTMIQSTAILGLAVVAGLLGAGGTWALWNTTVAGDAGTVRAAHFEMQLNGTSARSGVVTLDSPGGPLMPGTPVHTSFTVTNATDATGDFRLRAELGTPVVTGPDGTATDLSRNLVVQTAAQPASAGCAEATYSGTATAVVGKNRSVPLCVRFTLAAGAPHTAANSTARVVIPVTATQIPSTTAPATP